MSHHEDGHQAAESTSATATDDRAARDADTARATRGASDGAVATMPDDPEALRLQIADTRRRLGDTVAALTEKADVKTHVREQVEERKQSLREAGTSFGQGPARVAVPAAAVVALVVLMRRRR